MKYDADDEYRVMPIDVDEGFSVESYRTAWRRDYARLIHSPSFRRLQGKTQLFPGIETDFFRNRLTHSIEVAQIAKSIAIKLNHDLKKAGEKYKINIDIVEFASLAHDLGHPPFGHFGEEVLDKRMLNDGGYEGNAQTIRILSTLEKRHHIENTSLGIDSAGSDKRVGLNLAMRSIASVLKYDVEIPFSKKARSNIKAGTKHPVKGYYKYDRDLLRTVKQNILGKKKYSKPFKTIECQIMDIADDIAYCTYDLEDSFKAEFLTPVEMITASSKVLDIVSKKLYEKLGVRLDRYALGEKINQIFFDVFIPPYGIKDGAVKVSKEELDAYHFMSIGFANNISDEIARNAYYRTDFTSKLVGRFVRAVSIDNVNSGIPALSTVKFDKSCALDVEILKNIIYESQILSTKLQVASYRSKEIVEHIFDVLDGKDGSKLLPKDFKIIYDALKNRSDRKRLICDFIAGMTDRYAIEFYGRLTSENPQTIFKPI